MVVDEALTARARGGEPARTTPRPLAEGAGWSASDVVCTGGPRDERFEEQHVEYAVAIVVAGTFQYRSFTGTELMTPGSLLLGNPGQCFECGHEHGAGDRCVSFRYGTAFIEGLASDMGIARREFRALRVPPTRELAPVVAQACAALTGHQLDFSWEEFALQVATSALRAGHAKEANPSASVLGRVTASVREIERRPTTATALGTLARAAGMSPYHYLRVFERLTGVTPHQFVLRTRLRNAALRLVTDRRTILEVALDSGFGDLSNFNRAFRAEFGVTPRAYRRGV